MQSLDSAFQKCSKAANDALLDIKPLCFLGSRGSSSGIPFAIVQISSQDFSEGQIVGIVVLHILRDPEYHRAEELLVIHQAETHGTNTSA